MSVHRKKKNRNHRKMGNFKMEKQKDEEIQEEVVAETLDESKTEESPAGAKPEEKKEEDRTEELEKALEASKAEVADLKDRMLRLQADTENYKKRLLREKEDAVRYANVALVKDLLDPIDNFSRALAVADQTNNLEAFKSGVKMIEDNMTSMLKKNWGLEVIGEANVPFDPNEHEACLMEEVEGLKEDTVTMMLQRGYKLSGRVLRPAKVKVGKPKV